MKGLPKLPVTRGLSPMYRVSFSGLNHTAAAGDGEIFDMKNLTSDHLPVIAVRPKRHQIAAFETNPNGMIACGGKIIYIEGGNVHVASYGETDSDVLVGTVTDGEKSFAVLRNRVMIFPDQKVLDIETLAFGDLGSSVTATGIFMKNGVLYGVSAENNGLRLAEEEDLTRYFKVGDAVTISGCVKVPENNKTPIIREIDGDTLYFYENTFQMETVKYVYTAEYDLSSTTDGMLMMIPVYGFIAFGRHKGFKLPSDAPKGTEFVWEVDKNFIVMKKPGQNGVNISFESSEGYTNPLPFEAVTSPVTTETNVTVARTLPDMDFILSDDNRLWGAKGNTIYGSKLGDPTNFNVFDGLSTDSYFVELGSAGDITGAVNYNGYPIFFKEDGIFKLYGDQPSNYQIVASAKQGVKRGCGSTLAIAGEVLYYLSRSGVMAYTGATPVAVDEDLGVHLTEGVAVSDQKKYFLSAFDGDDWWLYVFDPDRRVWMKEDELHLIAASCGETAYGLTSDGVLTTLSMGDYGTEESTVPWFVEFADHTVGSPNRKGVARMQLRLEMAENAAARLSLMFDSDGVWRKTKEILPKKKRSVVLPIVPRRGDHFKIRIDGEGDVKIHGMTVWYYRGSGLRGD